MTETRSERIVSSLAALELGVRGDLSAGAFVFGARARTRRAAADPGSGEDAAAAAEDEKRKGAWTGREVAEHRRATWR